MAVLMPTTSPLRLNIGPPELPRLIEASVWMKSSYGPCWMSRARAETMPAVTVPPRPKGLPIASTQSPTFMTSLSPNGTAVSGLSVLTRRRARSVLVSLPTSSALRLVSSCRMTVISSASAMTWLLVTTRPEESMMKPDPSEVARRGCASGRCWPRGRFLSRKSLKNSSNGEPGGNCGISGRCRSALRVWVVETLTTAGRSFAASSEKPSGPALAMAGPAVKDSAASVARTNDIGSQPDTSRRRRLSTGPKSERLTAYSPWQIERDRASLRQTGAETHSFDVTSRLPVLGWQVIRLQQDGEIAARSKQPRSPLPCSPAHQPDGADTDTGGGKPDGAQHWRGHRQHLHDEPLHAVGEKRIEHPLDDQHERKRGP